MRMARILSLIVGTALVFVAASASAQAPPPPYGAPITLEQAKKAMAGAEAEAKKNSWPVVIVILDSGGQLVMLQRLDNTLLHGGDKFARHGSALDQINELITLANVWFDAHPDVSILAAPA